MESESSLYQKVWGEPERDAPAPDIGADAGYELHPVDGPAFDSGRSAEVLLAEEGTTEPAREGADRLILRRVEQVEARVSEIQRLSAETRRLLENGISELTDALNTLRWTQVQEQGGENPDTEVLRALEGIESRMVRLEKGVFRSLEYLDSRIEAVERRS
jgi:hypothetical protein